MPLPEDSSREEDRPSGDFANFVNRETEEGVFVDLLKRGDGGDLPVLMYYGMSGSGKSFLLEKLRRSRHSPSRLRDVSHD